jgi:hypothetical protein
MNRSVRDSQDIAAQNKEQINRKFAAIQQAAGNTPWLGDIARDRQIGDEMECQDP